ncbi:class I adenylate-forming enzyme family protein [Streptomyces sp. NPDC048002]|uniref:class I adenylate-forming enzyme family protein n=1 Tax=Streptomyces sp. NPDC048002 TaxID=3154344 RepID=UPI0033F0FAAA
MKTFKDILLWTEAGFGGKEAVVDLDRGVRWTYGDLNRAARSVCAAYAEAGVWPGDRVGWLAMGPGADITALSFGMRKMGVIPVVMNGRATPEAIAWMIGNVGMRVLAYTAETVDLLERVRAIGIPSVRHFVAVDEPVEDGHDSLARIYAEYAGADEPELEIEPDDPAVLIYTSGSTGRPKPVVHTETSWAETARLGAHSLSLYPDSRFMAIMPPHFAAWAHITSGAVAAAATQVCARFSPPALARAVAQGVTHLVLSPTMIRMLGEEARSTPELFADNDVRVAMLGGELATDEVLATLRRLFPKVQRVASHGATEAVALSAGPGDPRIEEGGALLGRPLPGAVVEIRNEETGEVITEPGVPGCMYVRGPMVAQGIWADREATAATFPGGWWRSGDVVARDGQGYLTIAGRTDNVFKSGAVKVQCEEVESLLGEHPAVLEAVVVPVPDGVFGTVGHAYVRHTEEVTEDELVAWWRGRDDVPQYARPRHWTLQGRQAFPMVTAAKVDRKALRREAEKLHV